MSKRKTKPATAGEKITIRWYGVSQMDLATIREAPCQWSGEAKDLAARIDRAIARSVKKERKRCGRLAFHAMMGTMETAQAFTEISLGVKP